MRFKRPLFILLSVVFVPIALLLVLETTLRIVGYGYPSAFIMPHTIHGQSCWTDNPRFAWRFHDPAVARWPMSFAVPRERDPLTVRVVILGSSAALGDPFPPAGMARMLEVMLQHHYPAHHVEVINAALTAINSHAVRVIAEDVACLQPDLYVVYTGNNEVIGPYGPGTVFAAFTPSLALIRSSIWLRGTRTGEWILEKARRWSDGKGDDTPDWTGLAMFLSNPVRAQDPRLPVVQAHFRRNLDDVIHRAGRMKAGVVLCTVAVNQRACPPFGSLHRPDLPVRERMEWDRQYQAGMSAETNGQPQEALDAYQAAERIDNQFAELLYRMARCLDRLDRPDEAAAYYERACDQDVLRFRADSGLNRVIRETADHHAGQTAAAAAAVLNAGAPSKRAAGIEPHACLVDVDRILTTRSRLSSTNESLFLDHVHFTARGNYEVARLIACAVTSEPPARLSAVAAQGSVLSFEACRQAVGYTEVDEYHVLDVMLKRLQGPPYTNQMNHAARVDSVRARLADLLPFVTPAGLQAAEAVYREKIMKGESAHTYLAQQLARTLSDQHRYAEAAAVLGEALDRFPQSGDLRRERAVALALAGQAEAALDSLIAEDGAIFQRKEQACNYLADLLFSNGQPSAARPLLEKAIRWNPSLAATRYNLGVVAAAEGRAAEAETAYREVLRVKPDHVPARLNLGILLAQQGRLAEAQSLFQEALRRAPDSSMAHYNAGSCLALAGRMDEAVRHYREAIRLEPAVADVHYSLAQALMTEGHREQALAELNAALTLNPSLPGARQTLALWETATNAVP